MLSTSLLLAAIACACLGFFFTCCCSTCTYASDNFDRTNNTDIDASSGVGWTEVSGTWDITSNKLVCSAAGIALCNTAHPDAASTMQVTVDISHDTAGSTVDVIVGYTSSTDYYYARFTIGGGSPGVDIRRNNGGAHSSIAGGGIAYSLAINTTYTAIVCIAKNGVVSALVSGTSAGCASLNPATITGTKAALGSSAANATFDNFSIAKSYDASSAASCSKCFTACVHCSGTVPTAYQCIVTGSGYAGTYLCDGFVPQVFYNGGTSGCTWYVSISPFCTTNDKAILTLQGGGGFVFTIRHPEASATLAANWAVAAAAPYDCTVAPGTLTPTFWIGAPCPNNAGSTVSATPIF